jgi:hypothetical protein
MNSLPYSSLIKCFYVGHLQRALTPHTQTHTHTQIPTSTFMTASIEHHGPDAEAEAAIGMQEQPSGTHPIIN